MRYSHSVDSGSLSCAERASVADSHEAVALDDETLMLMREGPEGQRMLIVVRLRGEGAVDLSGHEEYGINDWVRWELVLTTEDAPFAPDPSPPRVDLNGPAPTIRFARPSAVILRGRPVASASEGGPSTAASRR